MGFNPGATLYTQSFGSRPENIEVPTYQARAPASTDVNYPVGKRWIDTSGQNAYVLVGLSSSGGVLTANWSGGVEPATTTVYGTVILTDNSEPVATKVYADNLAIAGSPVSTETTAGIGQLATDAEAVSGTASTGLLALFVTPSNLAPVFASPPAIGGTAAAAGTFSDLTADGTGTVSLGSNAAADFTVTGAFDLTLATTAGSLVMTAGESATDAVKIESTAGGVQILASGAAAGEDIVLTATGSSIRLSATESATDAINIESTLGGINILASGAAAGEDINITATGSSVRITSTESATDSINIESTIGGINILASGAAAGEDINVTATGSSVNVTSTENAALAIFLHADGGTSETIVARADQGTGDASVQLLSDVGGVTLTGGKAAATAINLTTSNAGGGVTMTAGTAGILPSTTGAFTVISTKDAAQSIELHANGGTSETIRIRSDQGTGVASLDLLSDAGGVTIAGGLGTGNAINLEANTAGGGIDIDSSTGGFDVLTTGAVSIDASLASNLTVTGASVDLTVSSVGGSVVITGTEAAVDAVQINATTALGGVDINAGTGGITIDSGGAFSFDSAATSNITVTGAGADLNLGSVLGSVLVSSTEDAALAIRLHANAGTSETIQIHSDQGTGVASVGLLSDAGGITLRATGLASADAINLEAPAGGIDMDSALQTNITSSQAAATAVQITASDAAGGITMTATGTGGINLAGNVGLPTAASKISLHGGAVTDFIGTGTLTAGTVTIANTNIGAADRIFIMRTGVGASTALGGLIYTISAGASFTVTSRQTATPGATETADVSTFSYVIFRQTA
jgi:hypothetical protein